MLVIFMLVSCATAYPSFQKRGRGLSKCPYAAQKYIPTDTDDPLEKMNVFLQHYYQQNQKAMLEQTMEKNNVILQDGDDITLIRPTGQRITEPVTPELYTNLKLVCHVPLSAFVILYVSKPSYEYVDIILVNPLLVVSRNYQATLWKL